MIETRENIKTLLQISGTSKDTLIDMLMQLVESDIHDITKNYFIADNEDIYISADTISFEASSSKILDSSNGLDVFEADMSIKVFGSIHNDGIYSIASVAVDGSYITVNEDIIDEDNSDENTIRAYKLTYPKALKLLYSKMINFNLSKDKSNVVSEIIDNHSITFKSSINADYPDGILQSLKKKYGKFYSNAYTKKY